MRIPKLRRGLVVAALCLPTLAAAQTLSEADRAAVYQAAGLQARDGSHHRSGCDTPLKPAVELHDLDRDGRPEVLLFLTASRCFPESQGGNVALFKQDETGRWIERLGYVPGVEAVVQGAIHLGLPDLGIANPGGCMPVYRWNGSAYIYASQKALQPGGCQCRQ